MLYTVTIKEISKAVVDVEADSFEEALEKVKKDYNKAPLDYVLEPYDSWVE